MYDCYAFQDEEPSKSSLLSLVSPLMTQEEPEPSKEPRARVKGLASGEVPEPSKEPHGKPCALSCTQP